MSTQTELESSIDSSEKFLKILDSLILSIKHSETLENNAPQKKIYTDNLAELNEQKTSLTESIKNKKEKLENVKKLASQNKATDFPLPSFGDQTAFKADEVLILCSQFAGLEDSDFDIFYRKFSNFVTSHKLTEQCAKNLLSGLLKKDAFETFYELRDEPFQTIINSLGCRYSSPVSIMHYANKLKQLKRNQNEHLISFINRAKILISKSAQICPKDQQKAREKFLLLDILMKNCSSEARKKINEEQIKLARSGILPDFQSLLDLACFTEEDSQNESLGFNHANMFMANAAIRDDGAVRRREMRKHSPFKRLSDLRRSTSPHVNDHSFEKRDQSPSGFGTTQQQQFVPKQQQPVAEQTFVPQEQSSSHYSPPNTLPKRSEFRSYSPPPFRSNYKGGMQSKHDFGHRGSKQNYYATKQLSDLIVKLTDIFNILVENHASDQ